MGEQDIFEQSHQEAEEKQVTEYLLTNIENILLNCTQLIVDWVYQAVRFDTIEDDILRHLVVTRLSQPMSKATTVDYLQSYFDEDVQLTRFTVIWANCIQYTTREDTTNQCRTYQKDFGW